MGYWNIYPEILIRKSDYFFRLQLTGYSAFRSRMEYGILGSALIGFRYFL